ncbi:unnamed protein product [Rotaria sp. Silwood1]|nr:unnamed protein product [Rotaria sp. Silwood1]CAF1346144.1 unnamed protein product [Rotaria sp. Silwood1]CAF3489267.1 unnamed protein product [Rotaria sp. Silwood1]CAF4579095.1 unnamed protein product [Rotaria sp. Silwood1]CAF4745766.1 unnamed protein product [Rotaria sp. Silwood1]
MAYTSSIPVSFICPITQDIMQNPVLLVEDGHSYEQSALERWFKTHNTSPLTNKQLKSQTFVINYNLKSIIEDFCRQQSEVRSILDLRYFTLHRGCSQNDQWKNNPKLKIIISLMGPSNVGKSCLASNIEYGEPQTNYKHETTLITDTYFFYLDLLFEDKYAIIIQLNDCPGSDRFEAVSDRHFRQCHGAIFMADTTDISTFDRLDNYWYKNLRQKSLFDYVECVLACNKIDLLEKDHDLSYREKFFERADTFAIDKQMSIFNVSAWRGDNIKTMFQHLILCILQNQSLLQNLKESQIDSKELATSQNSKITAVTFLQLSTQNKNSSCC